MPIPAICHGPQILIAASVVTGWQLMAYPAVEPMLLHEVNQTYTNANANLVTAAVWPVHPQWIREFLDLLGTKIEA
jgi:protease I